MNTQEAYKTLGLEPNAGKDEAKKAFRNLSKKHHPDVEGGSDEKFKEINSAYQQIENPNNGPQGRGVHQRTYQAQQELFIEIPNVNASVSVSFISSIIGCKKQVSFKIFISCNTCNGTKVDPSAIDDCKNCEGTGQKRFRQGNMVFAVVCKDCGGAGRNIPAKTEKNKCKTCDGAGGVKEDRKEAITIPPGVQSKMTMRMPRKGNIMRGHQGHVHVRISVINDTDMSLHGNHVLSEVDISLLEALKGVAKNVQTIKGEKSLKIPPKISHGVQLKMNGLGIPGRGHQFVTVNVVYPDNVEDIIELLESTKDKEE